MSTARVIGRFIAVVIMLLLIVGGPLLLLALDAVHVATSARFLDSAFGQRRLYEITYKEIARDLARNLPNDPELRGMPIARLDAEGWERVLVILAPPESMQAWTRDAVQVTGEWLRSGGAFLEDVVLPFGQMRDNVIKDPNATVLRTVTEAQPLCEVDQEPMATVTALVPRCRPEANDAERFYARLAKRWQEEPDSLWRELWPQEMGMGRYSEDLSIARLIELEGNASPYNTRLGLVYASWAWRLTQVGVILLLCGGTLAGLALIVLLAARNVREALRWLGGPLVLFGATVLGLALLTWIGGQVGPVPSVYSREFTYQMLAVTRPVTRLFANHLALSMAWQGGLAGLVGLVLWATSFLLPKPCPELATSRAV